MPNIKADPTQLWRVFNNLINNALKHNPNRVRITINAEVEQNWLYCRISDDGVGISTDRSQTETIASLASGADAYCLKSTSLKGLLTAIAAAKEQAVYLDPNVARQVIEQFQITETNDGDRAIGQLSARELEVLKLIVDGKTNSEIADILYLSLSTVKTNIRGIMNKLAVNDRVRAAVVALRAGLV